MWADNETELDAINVQHIVSTVTEILAMPHLSPVTIGVFGPWGIGKSSVARMVQRALTPVTGEEKNSGTLVVYFNGWRFEGYEDAKAALMTTILEEIAKNRTLSAKARRLLEKLWEKVDVMQVTKSVIGGALQLKLAAATGGLSALPGITSRAAPLIDRVKNASLGEALEAGAKSVKAIKGAAADAAIGDNGNEKAEDEAAGSEKRSLARAAHLSVRDFDKRFKQLLDETKITRLVVIIDDLDRCLPDRVIETLEAIRLFLAVPGTAFVISADETLVQHAVKLRFPGMDALKAQVGQDYLEKMIQIPVRLPLLGRADLENYLNLLFAQRRLEPTAFTVLCDALIASPPKDPGRVVAFSPDTAGTLLGTEYDDALREDLQLASQIAHVVALSVDGNPRQVKRYLNALMLRLSMAKARKVDIPVDVAAKLMLLEYFRGEAFQQIGRWQATQQGRPKEIVILERKRLGASGAQSAVGERDFVVEEEEKASGDAGPAGADEAQQRDDGRRGGSRTSARSDTRSKDTTASRDGATSDGDELVRSGREEALSDEAAAWLNEEWLRAWLETRPRLSGVDLGPYFYFARDRVAARSVSTQQLGPVGEAVLTGLSEPTRAGRLAVRKRAEGLSTPEVFAVIGALAERARLAGRSDAGEESPFAGIYDLAEWRPEAAHEVVRFLGTLPPSSFTAGSPPRLIKATAGGPAGAAALALIERWGAQSANRTLATAAKQAVKNAGVLGSGQARFR